MNHSRRDIQLPVIHPSGTAHDAVACEASAHPGPEFWRSLDELAGTPEFEEYLHREFPDNASEWMDPVGRRQFLKLMGASLSLAGLASCTRQPTEKIVPYVQPPEQIVPGKPLFYATAMPRGGLGFPVTAESHMGRPIKIEGNEIHPASLGATDAFAQASILQLYDPDRSRTVTRVGQISTWTEFLGALALELEEQRGLEPKGRGLRLLTGPVSSPTLTAHIQTLLKQFPGARWHQYDPTGPDNAVVGAKMAFGEHEPLQAIYAFDKAEVVVSLDGDFLCSGPYAVRYARDFMAGRRVYANNGRMNRLYVAESFLSSTGAAADHRLKMRPPDIPRLARLVAQHLNMGIEAPANATDEQEARWVAAVARDLQAHRGASVVLAGESQPPAVHALACAINEALGNVGKTVSYIRPAAPMPVDGMQSLRELAADMKAGQVTMLVILGCNPVYDAPADLGFRELLADTQSKVKFRVHWGLYADETAEYCHWHIPAAHYLESWGDIRAYDGTVTILQPLIAPLYGGKTDLEVVAAMLGMGNQSAYDLVREHWRTAGLSGNFEPAWERALHDGLIHGTASPLLTPKVRPELVQDLRREWEAGSTPRAATQEAGESSAAQGGLTILFRPDPTIWDGQFANNAWLQELPKPLTKLTWDNAAMMSPATAGKLGLANEDTVELKYRGRTVNAPVWVVPGHADECVTVHLGYGRRRAGRVGTGIGFNAYLLRTTEAPWFDAGLEIRKLDGKYRLASTQHHHSLQGRHNIRATDLEEYRRHPDFAQHMVHKPSADMTLYPQPSRDQSEYAWGMVVDLNSCVGCNACVVACQAENNVPVVGKEQVLVSREMHWLRVDRYYRGDDPDQPETYHQPMMCVHCEYAPCEVVCPVAATVHSSEGLNDMVYNRCVGTRYCSNNCPYKVRRFNFLRYNDWDSPVLKLLRNPDVTVRSRGVMEKCTYCVQRINAARQAAKLEDRSIRDGEIVTACQQACPTQAIVFGNINDPNSRVSKLKAEQLNYGVLEELNTRPRTTYLAKVWNSNADLVGKEPPGNFRPDKRAHAKEHGHGDSIETGKSEELKTEN
ncbi:MAG TPA: TAT-variant-translocated molybdopterin oxidoreductase [Phycisphaerae bacterium]|nr:TAT-variant-translocated molybdopterin oxidoreductase [Phycisphaerae bacterium]HOB73846.1 TAT-variant-translocated molybdopterin oxidoreductase [Phycisphaerae bacterium]HOJ53939.1 TAT-variant-translocated molybdopterin oxidoreductase [Phycisphaerae bacterium]HOL27556.1 TAT-variant-translocated molybdopterin oxidoreductase [Phycisphaerae bacterium]HPP22561.1 TAT-variant-translocated molybdopterin oxidoreductase [Phycisphaerae bacterium]